MKHPLVIEASEMRPGAKFKDTLLKFMEPERVEALMFNVDNLIAHKLTYTSNGHKVMGFIVEPKEEKKRPVIIYNREGSNDFGKILPSDVFVKLGRLALWDYCVIASQYSGSDGGEGKDEIGGSDVQDVLVLRDILEKYPYADVQKVGMFGAGRGGLMTFMSLAQVDWIKAASVVGGIADIKLQEAARPEMKDFYRIMFGTSEEARTKRSAVNWANKFCKKSPVLLLHGANDTRVPPVSSAILAEKLKENKVPCKHVEFEGAEHALFEVRKEVDAAVKSWFDQYVACVVS